MGKFRIIKNSFLGGQVSGTAVGRTDLPQYQHSCEILQNMIPMLSGGAYRRPGTLAQTQYTTSQATPPRLLPFIVSKTEAYACALMNVPSTNVCNAVFMRATGGETSNASTATGTLPYQAIQASTYPNVVGDGDDDVRLVQYAQVQDVLWLTHPSYKPQIIKRTAVDTFTAQAFDYGLSGIALAQAYPYLNQNATSTYMNLSASSGTGVTMTCSKAFFNSQQIGAIFAIQVGTLTGSSGGMIFVQVTACSGTVGSPSTTCTVSYVVDAPGAFSTSGNYTEWWESAWSNYRGWPRSVCLFQQRLCMAGAVPVTGITVDPNGIPAGQPDSIWCSETSNYFKFSALGDPATEGVTGTLANGQNYTTPGNFVYYPVDDSEGDGQSTGPIGIQPFRVTLADSQLDSIQWLSPDQEILIGTLAQEWILAPQNGSFDVANSIATIQSHYGSDFVPAVRIGYELMFVLGSKDEVRAYQYNYIDASFFGEPVQLFFDEYPVAEEGTLSAGRRKFRQMDWDVTRNTLWCLDTAGNLFGMTRDRKLQVTMWHTHQFGGYNPSQGVNNGNNSGSTAFTDPAWYLCDGSVISVASVPNPTSGINDIWLCVKRTISGTTQWQIERMIGKNTVRTTAYESIIPGSFATEPFMVDAAVGNVFSSTPGTQYDVGSFLNGYTLTGTIYSPTLGMFACQSNVVGNSTDGSGYCEIPNVELGSDTNAVVILGLPFTPIIQPVRPEVPSAVGTSQGAIKRTAKVFLRLYRTLLASCGAPPGLSTSGLTAVPWAIPATMGQSPEIYTGDKEVFVATQYERNGYIYITQPNPFPFTVVSVISEGGEYEQ